MKTFASKFAINADYKYFICGEGNQHVYHML